VDWPKARSTSENARTAYNALGSPKSEAGERTVPITPIVLNALKEWKLQSGGRGLVFGNGKGNVESLANLINRGLVPPQLAAGITSKAARPSTPGCTPCGTSYASWCINPRAED
jgi:integrase